MAESIKTLFVPNVSTTLTAVLTVGSGAWAAKGQFVSLRAVNKGSVDSWVTVQIVRGSDTCHLLAQRPLSAKEMHAETLHQGLESGDVIHVQAGVASTIDLILSGYEGVD